MTSRQLRILGLVKTMNQVRAEWNAGLSPARADEFRQRVRATISQVEKICREQKMSPAQLPAPSYRAYRYLKSLDLNHLPHQSAPETASSPSTSSETLRFRNLVGFCSNLHDEFTGYAQKDQAPVPQQKPRQHNDFLTRIKAVVEAVEKVSRQKDASLFSLPGPSRRAYLWLKFLSVPDHLEKHLAALASAYQVARTAECIRRGKLLRAPSSVEMRFASQPALYRARFEQNTLHITANEGYTSAPPSILEDLVCAAFSGVSRSSRKDHTRLARVKAYAQSSEFRAIASTVEHGANNMPGLPAGEAERGPNDPRLVAIFQRVNTVYFNGNLPMPRLIWNRTITHRKLGHYQEAGDTVMISITLDQPGVPDFVLEFIVYHELLHKKIGSQLKNGRIYAHTRAFRTEERKFRQYEQAVAFLNSLGKNLNI